LHSLPGSYRLESEDGQKRAPPSIADALGQVVVPHHVGELQVFVRDYVVRLDQLAGCSVMEVTALVAAVLVAAVLVAAVLLGFRQERHRVASTVAPPLAPRHPALTLRQIGLGAPLRAGGENTRPIASCGERLNPQVYPGLLARYGQWLNWHVSAGDGDIPPVRFTPTGDGLGRSLNRAGPVDADTPDLRQDKEAIL
jgi:hypothetical protein